MKLVVIESPFAGDVARNKRYLKAAMLDCLRRGEAPFASHALYTQVLDDLQPDERRLGMEAGFAWGAKADLVAVYGDLGLSEGMKAGVARAEAAKISVEIRSLGANWDEAWQKACHCTGLQHRETCPEWEPCL